MIVLTILSTGWGPVYSGVAAPRGTRAGNAATCAAALASTCSATCGLTGPSVEIPETMLANTVAVHRTAQDMALLCHSVGAVMQMAGGADSPPCSHTRALPGSTAQGSSLSVASPMHCASCSALQLARAEASGTTRPPTHLAASGRGARPMCGRMSTPALTAWTWKALRVPFCRRRAVQPAAARARSARPADAAEEGLREPPSTSTRARAPWVRAQACRMACRGMGRVKVQAEGLEVTEHADAKLE